MRREVGQGRYELQCRAHCGKGLTAAPIGPKRLLCTGFTDGANTPLDRGGQKYTKIHKNTQKYRDAATAIRARLCPYLHATFPGPPACRPVFRRKALSAHSIESYWSEMVFSLLCTSTGIRASFSAAEAAAMNCHYGYLCLGLLCPGSLESPMPVGLPQNLRRAAPLPTPRSLATYLTSKLCRRAAGQDLAGQMGKEKGEAGGVPWSRVRT